MKFLFKLLGVSLIALAAAGLLLFFQYKGLRKDVADFRFRHAGE